MATSTYLGLNTKNIGKISKALTDYKKAITRIDFGATSKTVGIYAKGSASEKAIVNSLNNVEKAMDKLVNDSIKPFEDRISQLKTAYSKNDESQGTDFSTNTNNVLKS